ncbi:MAG TPA: hypothetical protein VK843_08315 [Planctomycetota bacterium]|nr:hypothetical protein [Planctomycetota bacterium]
MHYDFSQVQDTQSFVSIPEGVYDCRIAEVREGLARDGSVRWSYRLEVLRGEYAGRTGGWDALTWSERGISRVKRTLELFGIDVRGEVDLEPNDLIGLAARVTFESEEREDSLSGQRMVRLRVPYAGYARLENFDAAVRERSLAEPAKRHAGRENGRESEFDDPLEVDGPARA